MRSEYYTRWIAALGILTLGAALVGCPTSTVPDVEGMTQAAAEQAIANAGLARGTVTTVCSESIPVGQVISQTPAANTTVLSGTAVNLVVSLGASTLTVPDVVGQTQANAQTAIVGAGLMVGSVTVAHSGTVAVGSVLSQDPVAGTGACQGITVDLVISGELSAFNDLEMEAFDLVNDERIAEGLDALLMDEDVRTVARAHSQDMADRDFFAHNNPDGESPFDRLHNAGITFITAGENIAWNLNHPTPAATAVDGWMNSTGHRENILRESFEHTGMGVAQGADGGYYFTQVFTAYGKHGATVVIGEYVTTPLITGGE